MTYREGAYLSATSVLALVLSLSHSCFSCVHTPFKVILNFGSLCLGPYTETSLPITIMAYPSIGNSLSSISSITTLPPSPHLRPLQSDHGPRHPPPLSSNLPTTTARPTEANRPSDESRNDQSDAGIGLGSVPSPRPRFAHLTSSAPTRPRIPRVLSSSSVVRIHSPLNPASQESSSKAKKIGQIEEGGVGMSAFGGSVPQPRPNRLFASMLGSAPDKPEVLAKGEVLAKREVVALGPITRSDMRVDVSSSEEGVGEVTLSKGNTHHASPVRITAHSFTPSPEDNDESWRPRAPNSFPTFVELMHRPR